MDNEKAVKVTLEHSPRSTIFGVVLTSFVLTIICLIIAGTSSPSILNINSFKYVNCLVSPSVDCFDSVDGPLNFTVFFKMTPSNQFIYFELDFSATTNIYNNITYNFTLSHGSQNNLQPILIKNKTAMIECDRGQCESIQIFYLPYVFYSDYALFLQLNGQIPTDSVTLTSKFINKKFTNFELGVKYFFLAVSIISMSLFLWSLRKIPFRLIAFQTKLVGAMGISLIIFNEPLLAASIYGMSDGWSGLAVFSNVQFIACLLLYFYLSLQQFPQFPHKVLIFVIEAVVVLILMCLLFAVYVYVAINFRFNPTYDWKNDFNGVNQRVFSAAIFFILLIALWMVIVTVWSCCYLKGADLREKSFRVCNAVVMGITFIGIGAGAFQPIPTTATMVLAFVAIFNLYFITLQWIFSPVYVTYLHYKLEQANENSEAGKNNLRTVDLNNTEMIENKI